ncbi:helix-turn-helix domain-containing protein [Deinococcus sp. YIM 77859]|uniref:helix-turn-helix domain-containing protein n=1 Tax=Deinococcus sp. YIM 77859 TaxID=1540221 RepID=UPI0005594AA6
MTPRDLLTTEEVAAALGVTPGRVRQLVRDGRLKPEEITRRVHLFRREVVEAYKAAPVPRRGRPRKS